MRDYGFELEPAVIQSISELEEDFSNGLIQNRECITLESAKEFNPLIVLRWRKRECVSCNTTFDIASEGMMYKCGVCV
tara:strand:+ start:203 stop:436 length:234 start_codon:yes stop_codon:yes gene_type:complete